MPRLNIDSLLGPNSLLIDASTFVSKEYLQLQKSCNQQITLLHGLDDATPMPNEALEQLAKDCKRLGELLKTGMQAEIDRVQRVTDSTVESWNDAAEYVEQRRSNGNGNDEQR